MRTDGILTTVVSVVIRIHNGREYIAEALQSVLNQTYTHLEIIVIDDGSDGNPPGNLRRLKVEFSPQQPEEVLHEDVTLFRQPDHRRAQASRGRQPGSGTLPGTRHQLGHVLQMAQ